MGRNTRFFAQIILIFMVLFWVPGLNLTAAAQVLEQPEHIVLTWTADPATTQTVTWQTNEQGALGMVQFRPVASEEQGWETARYFTATMTVLPTNQDNRVIHSATLTGLTPGCQYLYRVGSETAWSEPHRFTTATGSATAFDFLVFGDSQSFNYQVWRKTLLAAWHKRPSAAFFINAGDLVDTGQDIREWDAWFENAQGVIDTIPGMPVTGNHEMYTVDRHFSLPQYFTAQLKLPLNGPEALKGQVYSFDYGNVHFAMLDSQVNEEGRFLPGMLDRERVWLDKDLAATDKKWKIVVLHRPPYNNKNTEDTELIRRAFVPLLDKHHVDLVFSGHDHVYARTYPLYAGEIMDNSAKGTVYVATGRSGTKTYQTTVAKEWNAFFHNPLAEPNYLTVHVEGDQLAVEVFASSGAVLDRWSINKEKMP